MFQMRKKSGPSITAEPKLDRPDHDQVKMPVLDDQPQGDATMNAGASLLDAQDLQPAAPTPLAGQGALLGKGARFEGKLTFEGTVEIQGEFYGEISSNGHLVVSEDARIEGTVEVASAHLSGHLKGNIKTSGTLELRSTAHVSGEIEVDSLTVEKGAFFQGQVTMTNT